jgi:hypothetical protein|tara:strand:- start:705 stop:1496 length:792 start_codon:yes stop_codon:yes gene_type:complete
METKVELKLKASGDRKVTNHATSKGALGKDATVNDRNSFALSASRCKEEYKTSFCDNCYAASLERFLPTVRNALEHNWQVIEPHLHSYAKLVELLNPIIEESVSQKLKRNVPPEKWTFRWFWDGEIPSAAFAKAMSVLARKHPLVKFWVYTRNFDVVKHLKAENLYVYLSTDIDNWEWAKETKKSNRNVMYAFNGLTWADTQQVAELCEEPKGLRCPELTGRIDLVQWSEETTAQGKQIGEGACTACEYCTHGKGNVRFSATN